MSPWLIYMQLSLSAACSLEAMPPASAKDEPMAEPNTAEGTVKNERTDEDDKAAMGSSPRDLIWNTFRTVLDSAKFAFLATDFER